MKPGHGTSEPANNLKGATRVICLHLASGTRAYACARHVTPAREELNVDDKVVSVARCSDEEGDCGWC